MIKDSGRSAAWLAHLLWEQGVGGSNPLAPTSKNHLNSTVNHPVIPKKATQELHKIIPESSKDNFLSNYTLKNFLNGMPTVNVASSG